MDILGAGDLLKMEEERMEEESISPDFSLTPLSSHIHAAFQRNKEARRNSGVEDDILLGVRMLTKEYSPEELELIKEEGGTNIYMPVGATKIRALVSWIKDILQNPKDLPFSIDPTEIPELPKETIDKITENVQLEFKKYSEDPKTTQELAEDIQLQNELRRDMAEMILELINEESQYAFKLQEKLIKDQLQEGDWDKALGEFIDDFAVYPTAFMKGPILEKKNKLKWVNGEAKVEKGYTFINKRINPLDMFPSPSSDSLNRGDLIEIIRTHPEDLAAMKGLPGWKSEAIDEILESGVGLGDIWTTDIASERSYLEKRGTAEESAEGVHFGFHYHGCVRKDLLKEWNIPEKDLKKITDEYVEIEAVLYGHLVAKVLLNEDPLLRRPYFCASFQNRSGSIWGISLPYLMDPIQRVCNSTIRALVNNMALSARPISVINIDRLADDGEISELIGGDIIQVTNDPHGSNSAPVTFQVIPSNATELLGIYNAFETKADDATMIPRYAYGGQDVRGAAATSSGLAMLMESAGKGIKDSVRHIDVGLIIPRVEYQFYFNMKAGSGTDFSGDIVVNAHGSTTLALKGAQELRRNEFLQATANPIDQGIMGTLGRATILSKVAEDLGLGESVIPNRFTLRKKEKEQKEMAEKQLQAAQGKASVGLEATKAQVSGQMQMHQGTLALKKADIDFKAQKHSDEMQLKAAELQQDKEKNDNAILSDMKKTEATLGMEERNKNKEIALELKKGE